MRITISITLPEGKKPSRALSAALAALAIAAPAKQSTKGGNK